MTERKQYLCYNCNEPFLFKRTSEGKMLRMNLNGNLHHCEAKAKTIATNSVKVEEKKMNEHEFVQKTMAKVEQNRQTEAERREEMIRMHDENVSAWNAQTKALNRLADVLEKKQ